MRGLFLKQALLILAVAFLPAIGEAVYFRNHIPWESPVPASELVKADTAKSWGAQALWVDARSDDEFARGHYPDALPLNEDHWNTPIAGSACRMVGRKEDRRLLQLAQL